MVAEVLRKTVSPINTVNSYTITQIRSILFNIGKINVICLKPLYRQEATWPTCTG